jgi:hypothetical protein
MREGEEDLVVTEAGAEAEDVHDDGRVVSQ